MKNSVSGFVRILLLLLTAQANSSDVDTIVQKVRDTYNSIESYCDRGTVRGSSEYVQEFQRCYQVNGNYKITEFSNDRKSSRTIRWRDGEVDYFFRGYMIKGRLKTSDYTETTLRPNRFKRNDTVLTGKILNSFSAMGGWLNSYKVHSSLSDETYTVLESSRDSNDNSGGRFSRIWIRSSDNVVTKYVGYRNTEILNTVEYHDIRINPILSSDDLTFAPPFFTRVMYTNSTGVFLTVLIAGSYVTGLIFWLALFLFKKKPDQTEAPRKRFKKFWKYYFYTIIISNAVVWLLGVVTLPLGGHPPLIVLSYLFSVYSISIAVLIGVFMLSASFSQKVGQKLIRK